MVEVALGFLLACALIGTCVSPCCRSAAMIAFLGRSEDSGRLGRGRGRWMDLRRVATTTSCLSTSVWKHSVAIKEPRQQPSQTLCFSILFVEHYSPGHSALLQTLAFAPLSVGRSVGRGKIVVVVVASQESGRQQEFEGWEQYSSWTSTYLLARNETHDGQLVPALVAELGLLEIVGRSCPNLCLGFSISVRSRGGATLGPTRRSFGWLHNPNPGAASLDNNTGRRQSNLHPLLFEGQHAVTT